MAQHRDTSRVQFSSSLSWLDGTAPDRTQRCRLPECSQSLERKPGPGRRRQFCSNACLQKFKRRRAVLADALREVAELSARSDWTWAERRALDTRERWLVDLQAEYATADEVWPLPIE